MKFTTKLLNHATSAGGRKMKFTTKLLNHATSATTTTFFKVKEKVTNLLFTRKTDDERIIEKVLVLSQRFVTNMVHQGDKDVQLALEQTMLSFQVQRQKEQQKRLTDKLLQSDLDHISGRPMVEDKTQLENDLNQLRNKAVQQALEKKRLSLQIQRQAEQDQLLTKYFRLLRAGKKTQQLENHLDQLNKLLLDLLLENQPKKVSFLSAVAGRLSRCRLNTPKRHHRRRRTPCNITQRDISPV